MEIFVYSRQAIEAINPHVEAPHLIVSIQTPGDPKAVRLPLCEQTKSVLRQTFHDLDDQLPAKHGAPLEPQLFSEEQAAELLAFVKSGLEAGVDRLIVHCDGGVSRSPAVAAAMALIFNQDDTSYFKRYALNRRVYRKLLEAHFGPGYEVEDESYGDTGGSRSASSEHDSA